MSTVDRRAAARANQQAAAFIRHQMLGDHEAMHYVLVEAVTEDGPRLAFITALSMIASSLAIAAMGRERALEYLRLVAQSSAALGACDDIDRYFDD
jgi:hypothetical protein